MRIQKIVTTTLLAAGLCSASTFAFAGLVLVNNTNLDSTSYIHGTINICSSALPGGVGVTKAHSTNDKITDATVRLACGRHTTDCAADVYMTTNCSGNKIATAVLDVKTGVKSVTMHSTEYKITASGFHIQLDGGPSFASSK